MSLQATSDEILDQAILRRLGETPFSFLCGPAGSGKTFLVRGWAEQQSGLELVATTGIAAINLGGTTINAMLGFFDTKSLQDAWVDGRLVARLGKLYKSGLRRILLDEVSMLDGDQLTFLVQAIEQVNQYQYVQDEEEPLGLTLVGDFAQLSPVKACYAFESSEWSKFAAHTESLTVIRRQADAAFISALRAARMGDPEGVVEYFRPYLHRETDDTFEGATLFAKNDSVSKYNWLRLERVSGAEVLFNAKREGKSRSEWGSEHKPTNQWGIPPVLRLRVGALVMILANKRSLLRGFDYVNGDIGTVVDVTTTTAQVLLHRTGTVATVEYVRREVLSPVDSEQRKALRAAGKQDRLTENGKYGVMGWVEYMPLRLAYASTVHKTQGLSLDAVQVNLSDHFFGTPGMVYVALSRARTVGGLRIIGSPELLAKRVSVDPKLTDFL